MSSPNISSHSYFLSLLFELFGRIKAVNTYNKRTMKFSSVCLACLLCSESSAFSGPRAFLTRPAARMFSFSALSAVKSNTGDLLEFDYLLQETDVSSSSSAVQSRRRVVLPSQGGNQEQQQSTVLASSTFAAPSTEQQQAEMLGEDATTESDPYADVFDSQLGKIHQFQEQQQTNTLQSKFKKMDLQDIIITLFIPGVALFAAGRWGYNRVAGRVAESADDTLDAFAREMLYHDGDFKEMELCVADYNRRLVWMGPSKRDNMLKRYLEAYAKKKTISPQAIASLSYAFTIFKLSEEKAAQLLVSLCRQMGTDKISSAGKLLFLGTRILKSPQGAAALQPIKDMIKSTYRDAEVADTLVETSQHAIAEAAYRATVQGAGKNQKSLTVGWEVLGLDRSTAERIFSEEAKDGFVSDREAMYGGQSQRYDKKGRKIDKDGNLEDPEEAAKAEEEDDDGFDGPVSNVYECGECGHTLFVAQGRESKFFGDGFKCPDCGAPKDKFIARDDMDD